LDQEGLTSHSTNHRSFWSQHFYNQTSSVKALKEGG